MVFNPLSPSSASDTSPTASGGYGLLDDVPPSYDSISTPSASAPSVAGGSSSGAAAGPSRAWPVNMDTLFTGPPNGEPLITRTRAGELPTIETHFVGKATKNGRLESWDKQLNDPAVLYDFIRAQALKHPKVVIRCKGTHQETASHSGMVISNGSPQHVHAGTKYTVVDFDFTIDLTPILEHTENYANVHLQAKRAHVPAYRGGFQRTYGTAVAPNAFLGTVSRGKVASWSENSRWDAWAQFMKMRGRAPWSDMEADEEFRTTYNRVPSASIALGTDEEALLGGQMHTDDETPLRQWCEAYCADPGILKSFTLSKAIWGWDLANLKMAIERAILSTGYDGMLDGYNVHIDYQFDEDYQVVVRPDNWLVRIVNHPFWFIMLCVTCIYPFIWIWQRLSRYGGGSYEVAVASYGMKFYPPLPSTFPGETIDHARDRLPAMFKLHPEVPRYPFLHRGPRGIHYLLGRREGEWFREWEERIRMAVRMKYSGELVNTRVAEDEEPPELDGY